MARLRYGGTSDGLVYDPGSSVGERLRNRKGLTGVVYDDQAMTSLADIETPAGVPIVGSVITVTSDSLPPEVDGPDNDATSLWILWDGEVEPQEWRANVHLRFDTLEGELPDAYSALEAAPYTLYVNQASGSDANNGKSVGKPFLTLAKAANVLALAKRPGVIKIPTSQAGYVDLAAPLHFALPTLIEGIYPGTPVAIRRNFATPNSRTVLDGVTTAAGTNLASASAAFAVADENRYVMIEGAGTGGGTYYGKIVTRVNATNVTLSSATAVARNTTVAPGGTKATVIGSWSSLTTGSMTSGQSTLTAAAATSDWLGKELLIAGAGRGGQYLRTLVTEVNGTTVTVMGVASATVAGVEVVVGPVFGDGVTFHAGGGLKNAQVTDTTNGNARIGSAVKLISDDPGASPAYAIAGDVRLTDVWIDGPSDAAGAWESNLDIDGSWSQRAGGPGVRRCYFNNVTMFGSRLVGRSISMIGACHIFFASGLCDPAPSTARQGMYASDPSLIAGGQRSTVDIHFTGFELIGDLDVGAQDFSWAGGRIGSVVALIPPVTFRPNADKCSVVATTNATVKPLVSGTACSALLNGAPTPGRPDPALVLRDGGVTFRESFDRRHGASSTVTPTSGVLLLAGVPLFAGDVIGRLGFAVSSTPVNFGTSIDGHWYLVLVDEAGDIVAQTADQGMTAIAAFSTPTKAVVAPLTVPRDQFGHVGLLVNLGSGSGTSMCTLKASNSLVVASAIVLGQKTLCGTFGAGLTAPPAAAVPVAGGNLAYMFAAAA